MLLTASGRAPTLSFDFPLSRAAALARLASFVGMAGWDYAEHRNEDAGPGRHQAVSRLSAALRRRLIGEEEVARAVLAAQAPEAGRSFLGELFWRTYWKGWLEQHPGIWRDWRAAVAQTRAAGLPADHAAAVEGRTGIDAFDFWVRELRDTGYLHNWARMQFASIWIFTLGLPWELGAAFTFDHFVDADPASNTLSWRWVAGLHRNGRPYLADADRIARRTGGRFAPQGLATHADVPRETAAHAPTPFRPHQRIDPERGSAVLVTPEDLSLETQTALADLDVRGVIACRSLCQGAADIAAVADGVQRAGEHWGVPTMWVDDPAAAAERARAAGCTQLVTGYAAIGPTADALGTPNPGWHDVRLAEAKRDWDARAWPLCDRGYFAFAKHIPALLTAAVEREAEACG